MGAQGPAGATGASGANATRLFIQIDSKVNPPVALRSSGVTSLDGPSQTGTTGNYEVGFDRNVDACVAVASLAGKEGFFPAIGTAGTVHLDTNLIGVQTADKTGAPANNLDFSLAVFC